MAKQKTTSLTFRCPEDLYNSLSNFALDNNIVKDGKPIITEALIAALSLGLGGNTSVSQDVRHSDIETKIDDAIAAKLDDMQEAVDAKYSALFAGISANINELMQQRDREIDSLSARIEALSSEATATAKKAPVLAPHLKALALEKILQVA